MLYQSNYLLAAASQLPKENSFFSDSRFLVFLWGASICTVAVAFLLLCRYFRNNTCRSKIFGSLVFVLWGALTLVSFTCGAAIFSIFNYSSESASILFSEAVVYAIMVSSFIVTMQALFWESVERLFTVPKKIVGTVFFSTAFMCVANSMLMYTLIRSGLYELYIIYCEIVFEIIAVLFIIMCYWKDTVKTTNESGKTQRRNIVFTEPINYEIVKFHKTSQDLKYRALLSEYYKWIERFNHRFELNITQPVIAIKRPVRRRYYGLFFYNRNPLGLKYQIIINENYLKDSKFWHQIGTILHECLHLWQLLYGKPGRGNYHNRQFRDKALSLGLIVDRYGHTKYAAENSPFFNLLAEYNVELPSWCSVEKAQLKVSEKRVLNAANFKSKLNKYLLRIKTSSAIFCEKIKANLVQTDQAGQNPNTDTAQKETHE